jgi:hypothetical protein
MKENIVHGMDAVRIWNGVRELKKDASREFISIKQAIEPVSMELDCRWVGEQSLAQS